MSAGEPGPKLSERDRQILRGVVQNYWLTAEPVSSRRLAKDAALSLSSASIRNTMADLEEMGLLRQPHASAGRIPTARGYHVFIDDLMEVEAPSEEARRMIDNELASGSVDQDELTSLASQLLSELSSQVGIVVTPEVSQTTVSRIEFVPLTERKILCVVVSSSGFVDNKVVQFDEDISRSELVRLSNYVSENFAGRTLAEIRTTLLNSLAHGREEMDQLLARAIRLARDGLEVDRTPHLAVQGTEGLLGLPELSDLGRVRRLFDTFADRARVAALLGRCIEGEAVRVYIGDESDLTSELSELDFSLIVKGCSVDGKHVGGIGVFGPARMEYGRLIPLVDYLGERLSAALEGTI